MAVITITDIADLRVGDIATLNYEGREFTEEVWAATGGEMLVGGTPVRYLADQRSAFTFISAARETPESREPKPGEAWRLTLSDGSECSAVVCTGPSGAYEWWMSVGWVVPIDVYPPSRSRILVEADGTLVSNE